MWSGRTSLPWTPVFALAAAVLAGVGCAGGDSEVDRTADAAPLPAVAEEPPAAFARHLADALAGSRRKRDCDAIEAINDRSAYRFTCPAPRRVRRSMDRFELRATAAYGSAAVVDYETEIASDGGSMVLMLDPQGRWTVTRFGLVVDESVGSDDGDSRAGFARAANRYLTAVEERDCELLADMVVSALVEDRDICRVELPATRRLARSLRADPGARPRYLGGNGSFGFFGIATSKPEPRYVTLSAVRTVPGTLPPFMVLDQSPGPVPRAR